MMSETDKILNNFLAKVALEQRYEPSLIHSKPLNIPGVFSSHLFKSRIMGTRKDPLFLFVKVAANGVKIAWVVPGLQRFRIERFAYTDLLMMYAMLEAKYDIPKQHRYVVPRYYASSAEYRREAIALEDLSKSGYIAHDRFKSVDWDYAFKSIQNLAKFHALSIVWSIEDPMEFNNIEDMRVYDNWLDTNEILTKVFTKTAVDAARDENKGRLMRFSQNLLDTDFLTETAYRPLRRPVMVHGDYRPSNLMHRVNKDGSLDVITVDYQTLQKGNPLLDLLTFVYVGTDKKFRDQHYRDCLESYYVELRAALSRFGLDPNRVYPRGDFDYELLTTLPAGLAVAMYCLLLVTVADERAPNPATIEFGITDFLAIPPSALYKQRLNEVIDDYVDMGVI